jgi:hypothetical protein
MTNNVYKLSTTVYGLTGPNTLSIRIAQNSQDIGITIDNVELVDELPQTGTQNYIMNGGFQ